MQAKRHGHPAFLCYIDLYVNIENDNIIHKHPAFLCYIVLYVSIENNDIIHNMTIPPKSFLLDQNNQYVKSEQVIVEILTETYTLNLKKKVREQVIVEILTRTYTLNLKKKSENIFILT